MFTSLDLSGNGLAFIGTEASRHMVIEASRLRIMLTKTAVAKPSTARAVVGQPTACDLYQGDEQQSQLCPL